MKIKNIFKSIEIENWILLCGAVLVALRLINPICEKGLLDFRCQVQSTQTFFQVIAIAVLTSVVYIIVRSKTKAK